MPLIVKKPKATGNKEIDEKIAKAVKNANQKTKKLKRGEWKWRVKNNVGFIIWKYNKLVSVLSTAQNSRPLTHVSVEPGSEEALTPNHFLLAASSGRPVPATLTDRDLVSRSGWRKAVRVFYRSDLSHQQIEIMSDTSESRWEKQVRIEIPAILDQMPGGCMPYDESLLQSMDMGLQVQSGYPTTSSPTLLPPPSSPQEQEWIPDSSQQDPVRIFKAKWGGLRKECADPKTTRVVLATMRNQALTCIRDSKVIDLETLEMLDQNWDMLGVDRVCTFVDIFLVKKLDEAMVRGPGPRIYLKGLIDSMRATQTDQFMTFLESLANATADIRLTATSIDMFRKSMTEAEGIWRDQSSLCSKYLANLESQLKLIKLQANTPMPNERETSRPQTSTPPEKKDHSPYRYEMTPKGYRVFCDGVNSKKTTAVTGQVNKILEVVPDTHLFVNVNPEVIYTQYMSVSSKTGDKVAAVKSILHSLQTTKP